MKVRFGSLGLGFVCYVSHVFDPCLKTKIEDGSHDGYPRYVERNKNDGSKFVNRKGAEIKYCKEIGSWVFMHENIFPGGNECSWLWKSHQTRAYDILSTTDSAWSAWVGTHGEVKQIAQVAIICNECSEKSDCNYHGFCEDQVCSCDDTHFGVSCELEVPCQHLASEKAHKFGENESQTI